MKGVAIRGCPKLHRVAPRRTVNAPCRIQAWLRPISSRPRYYDLLSRKRIEQIMKEEIVELARLDEEPGTEPVMTWKSALLFFHGFFIFHIIPLSIRYAWYRFWKYSRLKLLYPLQKKWALLDARFDAILAKLGSGEYRFSRTMVAMRLHKRIGPGRELKYRWGLLMGKDVDHCAELFRLHSPPPSSQKNLMSDDDT